MKIEVHHYDQIGFTHVATVTAPDAEVWEALDYAYRWTNNIDGSWSIKERTFEGGHENGDFNPAVEVVAPLHVDAKGKTWGLRSSMMGDVFIVDGKRWVVATFGFEEEDLRA
jgi:hypothetical protein